MSNPADARRRWFGLFFLFIALGLLIWGQTILKPYLDGLWFILYWLACFAFTILALLTALLDFWIMRRRMRGEHRALFRDTFREDRPSGDPPRSAASEPSDQDSSGR